MDARLAITIIVAGTAVFSCGGGGDKSALGSSAGPNEPPGPCQVE